MHNAFILLKYLVVVFGDLHDVFRGPQTVFIPPANEVWGKLIFSLHERLSFCPGGGVGGGG